MSALKHGFFSAGFMLCDRCVLNTSCGQFKPGLKCVVEKEVYDWLVEELTRQYGLEGLADKICVWRAAMYLIRIARVETYEAIVGVTEKSVLWGSYISRLDNTLRRLLNDLAITRLQRKRLKMREELMVDIENLLERLTKKEEKKDGKARRMQKPNKIMRVRGLRIRPITMYEKILADWRKESDRLRRGKKNSGEEEDSP